MADTDNRNRPEKKIISRLGKNLVDMNLARTERERIREISKTTKTSIKAVNPKIKPSEPVDVTLAINPESKVIREKYKE
ncbi:MAG: hypothetical protein B2I17_02535 [Thermoplasmatales archaeon B_DKE]|nr:MAG: hypothetical protein B2I17_02535 [Thermoplasmatales archaeon B_DKE]